MTTPKAAAQPVILQNRRSRAKLVGTPAQARWTWKARTMSVTPCMSA
jgi:hypothetical protein